MRDRDPVHRAVLQRLRAARDAADADDAFESGDRDTQAYCTVDPRGQAFAVLCEISALGRDEQRVEVALQSGSPGISFSASRPAIQFATLRRRRARNAVGWQALNSEHDLHGATDGGGGVAPASNRARTSAATASVRRRSTSSKTTSARRRD